MVLNPNVWSSRFESTDLKKELHKCKVFLKEVDRVRLNGTTVSNALDLFLSFLPLTFWKTVRRNTVEYAKSMGVHDYEFTLTDLMRWLGLVIIWGLWHSFPSLLLFWSTHWVFDKCVVSSIMTLKEFKKIRKYFHVSNNANADPADKFNKIRPMSEILNQHCVLNYSPHRELSYDEMTPGSQHRSHLVKITKHKKVPSGIDVKALCDAHSSYVIYHRFGAQPSPQIPGLTATGSQVVDVIRSADLNSYHEIFFDNLYTSPTLFTYLWTEFRMYCTGTWRANFGVPRVLIRPKTSNSQRLVMEKSTIKVSDLVFYC